MLNIVMAEFAFEWSDWCCVGLVKARLIIKGNVHGVGFRVWAGLFARRLGVGGLVRNLPDGSVESFVEGSKQAVEEFVRRISVKGVSDDPLSLHVEEVEVFWEGEPGYKPPWKRYEGFEIDYGAGELRAVDKEMFDSLEWSKLHFAGMSRVFREEFGDMKGVFREELGGLKKEVKAVGSEVHNLRDNVDTSFEEMAKRYDAISSELIRTREELTRAVNTLVELVKKFGK
jgi:acylphosphatase